MSEWDEHDQAMFEMHSRSDGPVSVAHDFWLALKNRELGVLGALVTPESLKSWGDFSEIADIMWGQIDAVGLGTQEHNESGIDDISYVAVYENVTGGRAMGTYPIAYLTLIHRREVGGWRVHAFGAPVPAHIAPRSPENRD